MGKRYKISVNKLSNYKKEVINIDKAFEEIILKEMPNLETNISSLKYIGQQIEIISTYRNMLESNLLNTHKLLDNIAQNVQNRITLLIAGASLIVSTIAIWQ